MLIIVTPFSLLLVWSSHIALSLSYTSLSLPPSHSLSLSLVPSLPPSLRSLYLSPSLPPSLARLSSQVSAAISSSGDLRFLSEQDTEPELSSTKYEPALSRHLLLASNLV